MPGFGASQRLARLVGTGIAKEILFTGRMINAERPMKLDWLTRLSILLKY